MHVNHVTTGHTTVGCPVSTRMTSASRCVTNGAVWRPSCYEVRWASSHSVAARATPDKVALIAATVMLCRRFGVASGRCDWPAG